MIEITPVSNSVSGFSKSLCPDWDVEPDIDLIQSIAETTVINKRKAVPKIVDIVLNSTVPYSDVIGSAPSTANDFYDNLAGECSPDSFLDILDMAEVRGDLPEELPGYVYPNFRLPGHDPPKEDCGRFFTSKTYGCPKGHEVYPVMKECGRLACKVCYPGALRRMADRVAAALDIVSQLYNGPKFYHISISPPPE